MKPKSRDNSPTCPAARRGEESVFPTCDVAGAEIFYLARVCGHTAQARDFPRAREEGREGGGGYHYKNQVIKKRTKKTVLLQPCMGGVEGGGGEGGGEGGGGDGGGDGGGEGGGGGGGDGDGGGEGGGGDGGGLW